ncbi:dTMP kinase [Marinomonas sp. 15G1-11]|uniref:Thymidylate kinase n=1 Tax=Marinomonas phaeophyticola TaxID=3004091 RepID=A0ABT4JV23_9GAMM|nr:dTMP kinase [Marinomonas sp. 15G1-11]MCZ2722243.1 dTMP kinase [Marinomonas sp. 15G1-11]
MRGKFISLEGGEGSGKSTSLAHILSWLDERNIPFITTREPGGTPLAEEIRSLVLNERDEKVHDMTELLLVFASRAQHINEKIKPALDSGVCVISDRFVDSSFVYQGVARQGNLAIISTLTDWVVGQCLPDKTILLDVPVEIGLARVQARQKIDRLDKESVLFHESVRSGFMDRAKADVKRFSVIDASQALDLVLGDIDDVLTQIFESSVN